MAAQPSTQVLSGQGAEASAAKNLAGVPAA